MRSTTDFKALLDEATAASSKWPADVGSAYLLEVSAAAYSAEWFPRLPGPSKGKPQSFSGGPLGTPRRRDCIGLLKLASVLAQRTAPNSEFGRAWASGALSLLEAAGAGNDPPPRDMPPPEDFGSGPGGPRAILALLDSMGDRLDKPTVLLARGMIYQAEVADTLSFSLPTVLGNMLDSGDGLALSSDVGPIRSNLDRAISEGMKAFAEAQQFPAVRAEAAARWGALALARNKEGDILAALAHFKIARESNPDHDVLYVSWLLDGQAHKLAGETEAALASFKQAADLAPNGSVARLSLAVQTFLAGDTTTAGQLAQQILNSPVSVDDPWILFQYGDYRHWPDRVADLRKAIR